jgi:hypothetical protein
MRREPGFLQEGYSSTAQIDKVCNSGDIEDKDLGEV